MRAIDSVAASAETSAGADPGGSIGQRLTVARRDHMERPDAALAEAMRCQELARATSDVGTVARAVVLQGLVSLHRGDLRSGVRLAVSAAAKAEVSADLEAQAEVAALRAVLSLFTGAYSESVAQAKRALALADRHGERELALFVRRMTTMVFGNLHADGLAELLEQTLALAGDDPREEALSRNDIATHLSEEGEHRAALDELARAFQALEKVPQAHFARAVLHVTRAEIELNMGDARRALIDSHQGLALLAADVSPNPYLLGAAVQAQVRGLIAIGELESAHDLGENTLSTLGERVPQMRGVILSTIAEALRSAGRMEEAYATLSRASELEREAFGELIELQMSLERATLAAEEARRHTDALMAKNRELAEAHAELERRSRELELLQDQLRDQAERDWLTGLHNRRYLAGQLEALASAADVTAVGVAIVDLDDFKAVNDRFGHAFGDRVLVDVAALLRSLLRPADVIVRSGGEEFTIVMPDTEEWEAVLLCERIRERVLGMRWPEPAPGLTISTSVGVAWTDEQTALHAVIEDADRRLFEAKRAGRNRVISGGF